MALKDWKRIGRFRWKAEIKKYYQDSLIKPNIQTVIVKIVKIKRDRNPPKESFEYPYRDLIYAVEFSDASGNHPIGDTAYKTPEKAIKKAKSWMEANSGKKWLSD